MSAFELSVLFFLQLAFILVVCRLMGWLARWVGQPQVVSEMIAGVVLGPSLFGLFLPDLQKAIFPAESRQMIYIASQVGLVLYMFLVGLEFDVSLIRQRLRIAATVSISGILVPFVLGGLLGLFLLGTPGFFRPDVNMWEAMFFVGASMSITAFPMLARIIHERKLTGTFVGTIALAAGSIDDAAAWCVLALVLASFNSDPMIAVLAIGGGILYATVAMTIGQRLLKYLGQWAEKEQGVNQALLTVTLILVMLGAWITDSIGIYAVFGAFVMGIAMPKGRFSSEVQRQLEPLTTTLLLPLFFVYSGLNTRIGLVDSPFLWLVVVAALVIATMGKGVACWAAVRWSGGDNRSALAVGTLMNARGLMELIILNIGLEHGLIEPVFFTIMVIMAIITTLIATPIFELVFPRQPVIQITKATVQAASISQ